MKLLPSIYSIRPRKSTDSEYSRIALADAYDPLFCYSLPFSQAFEFFTKTFRTRTQAESVGYFEGVDAAFAPV